MDASNPATPDKPDDVHDLPGAIEDPPGDSAVEIAARGGFGPLSTLGQQSWHGDSRPCVSCGQLARRHAPRCPACSEDLTPDMLARMRAFSGPWYVHEHVRPFPGVTFERLLRQIRRGVLTQTTIVRGPTTDHQWQYAAETPGLSKYLGVCWSCHAPVSSDDEVCLACNINLGELTNNMMARGQEQTGSDIHEDSPQLRALREALTATDTLDNPLQPAPGVGYKRVTWIVIAILTVTIATLYAVIQIRDAAL